MREEGEQVLRTAESLLPLNGGPVLKFIEVGKPIDVILSVAGARTDRSDRDGLARCRRLTRIGAGSVSHRVVTHAAASVLVVSTPLRPVQQIVLAVDAPKDADVAVRWLARRPFKEKTGAITVLSVIPYAHPAWPVGAVIPEPWQKEVLMGATQFAEQIASKLTALGYRAKGTAVQGSPASEILKAAATEHADLIVMGSRHRGLSRAMLGSTSHAVLHRATCPVLIVR